MDNDVFRAILALEYTLGVAFTLGAIGAGLAIPCICSGTGTFEPLSEAPK